MGGFETGLELTLLALLGATLFHAIRLHRAIAALRSDRASLDNAVAGFDSGTRQAEQGMRQLRDAAKTVATQIDELTALRDDLTFLDQRGTQVADRLDALVRTARSIDPPSAAAPAQPVRSQAERDLLLALRHAR
jgi:exonuclease VII small subunit